MANIHIFLQILGTLFGARAQRISRQHSKEMGLSPDELRNIAYGIPLDSNNSQRRRNSEETIYSGSSSVRSTETVVVDDQNHATSEESEYIVVDDQDHAISEEPEYICPECKGDANLGQTICCDKCEEWFHFVCVGITENDDCVKNENASFFCKKCKKPPKSSHKRKRVSKNEKKASKRPKLTLRQVVEDQGTSDEPLEIKSEPLEIKSVEAEASKNPKSDTFDYESWQKSVDKAFTKVESVFDNYYENQKEVHGWFNQTSEELFAKNQQSKLMQEKIDNERADSFTSWWINAEFPKFNENVFVDPMKTFIQEQLEDPEFNETDFPLYSIVSNL